jgi:hypothetical protein
MPVYDDGGGGRARWTATAAHDFSGGGDAAAAPAAAAGRWRTRSTTTLLAMAGRADTRSARHPDEGLSLLPMGIRGLLNAVEGRRRAPNASPRQHSGVGAPPARDTVKGRRLAPNASPRQLAVWAPHPHVTIASLTRWRLHECYRLPMGNFCG